MLLPTHSKINLPIIFTASLFFLIGGLRPGKNTGTREAQLSILAGLAGLLYVGADVGWYFYIRFLQSHTVTVVYYFAVHVCGGISVGILLHIIQKSAKVLLAVSAALFVVFNSFVIDRHIALASSVVGIGDGLFCGILIASLVVWFGAKRQNKSDRTMPAVTD